MKKKAICLAMSIVLIITLSVQINAIEASTSANAPTNTDIISIIEPLRYVE